MPWKERGTLSLRKEFVVLARAEGVNVRQLCRQFGISPKTGYKWLARHQAGGLAALDDRSRRPHRSPRRTEPAVEGQVLDLRTLHTAWGGRKIRARLRALGHAGLPAPSTITDILRRNGRIEPEVSREHRPLVRFEHPRPNDLWQMDFKGDFAWAVGRCYPLTVLDDHSRFALGLRACLDEQTETVQAILVDLFRTYGCPLRMLMDNGSPWGCDAEHRYTPLTAWLIRLTIRVSHGRPYHPQTQGKDERFHRTLNVELLRAGGFVDAAETQRRFDAWRDVYNLERPHEALGMATPASRYQVSPRAYPETLPPIEYGPGDAVRRVQQGGHLSFQGYALKVSKAFAGYPIALRPTTTDGAYDAFFCHEKIASIDLRTHTRG
jgi:transposase InsO family protein